MSLGLSSIVVASLLASAPVPAHEARAEVGRVLDFPRYEFCDAATAYVPETKDLRWCELAAASEFRACPGYARVCNEDGSRGAGGSMQPGGGESNTPGENYNGRAGRDEDKKTEENQNEMPVLGGVARVLMWVLFGLIVFGVVFALFKYAVRGREEDEGEEALDLGEPLDASESLVAAKLAARRVVETDVQRLLDRADQAAQRGDHDHAIADVYAALVRRLEGEELIRVDRWKTNGDYLRALRSKEALRDEVRVVIREVEQIQFGAAQPSGERYRSIRSKVVTLVGRAVLAFVIGVGLGAQTACDGPESGDSAEPRSSEAALLLAGLGNKPADYRAPAELLLGFDIDVRHRLRTIGELEQTEGAIVVLDTSLEDEHWRRLLDWVEQEGGMLVIASTRPLPSAIEINYASGSARSASLEIMTGYEGFEGLELAVPDGGSLEAVGDRSMLVDVLLRWPDAPLDSETPAYGGLMKEGEPYVVRRNMGVGQVVVFAEPDMWNNAGLIVADNAAFLVNLFREAGVESVEFVDSRTGSGPQSPMQSMQEAELTPLFAQLLLFLALLYAAVGIPFGRLRDPIERSRRSFAEHVRTLGQRYAQARAASHVAGLYSAWAVDHLRARLLPSSSGGLLPLAQAIAARSGRSEGEVMAILVEAHGLREANRQASRGDAHELELMRALADLVEQCGRVQ